MKKLNFRTKYHERKVFKSFKGVESLTDQQYKDDCSINGIIKRYGVIPPAPVTPLGSDVSELGDFADCLQRVSNAMEQFKSMPSEIRARFGHDPRAFYDFVLDPRNAEEGIRLGLFERKEEKLSAEELLTKIVENTSPEKEKKVV